MTTLKRVRRAPMRALVSGAAMKLSVCRLATRGPI